MIGENISGFIFYKPTRETLFNKSLDTKDFKIINNNTTIHYNTKSELLKRETIPSIKFNSIVSKKAHVHIGGGYPTFKPHINNNTHSHSTHSGEYTFALVDPGSDPIGQPLSVGDGTGVLLLILILYVGVKRKFKIIKKIKQWK